MADTQKFYDYMTKLIENNDIEALKTYLSAGHDPDPMNEAEETPLFVAAMHDNVEAIDLLIKSGADINHPRSYGQVALDEYAESLTYKTIRYLLNHGSLFAFGEMTLLHYQLNVSDGEFRKLIDMLVKSGIDLDKTDYDGRTALMQQLHRPAVALYLLASGASADVEASDNRSALHEAAHVCETEDCTRLLKVLVKHSHIDAQDSDGNTPLHIAVMQNNMIAAKFFMENGADISIKNEENKTVVEVAKENKQLELCEILTVN